MKSFVARFLVGTGLLALLATTNLPAQTISGIVNTYAKVLVIDTCENSLLIDNASGFSDGDRVLIIQMKGATIDVTNTANFGSVLNMGSAGDYEFTYISSIKGLKVILQQKIEKRYDVASAVQLIKVPQYNDVTISDTLTCKLWDGLTGGVLVFEASGTVTLQKAIDVSKRGFRGGDFSRNKTGPDSLGYFYSLNGDGGVKGEGIAQTIVTKESGRGAQANGGGGGNNQNAGGGGGANGGTGGKGGMQTNNFASTDNGGLGGKSLDYTVFAARLVMGGGGGGGQANDSYGTKGGNGGGLIIIRADSIDAANQTINATGDSATESGNDGAGGGGGGGTIAIATRAIVNPVYVSSGGRGGNSNPHKALNTPFCFAPGGGGAGGRIYVNGATPAATVLGAKAGTVVDAAISCFGTTYGATDGTDGVINTGFVPFDSKVLFTRPTVLASRDTTCEGDTTMIGVSGGKNFSWTPANTVDDPAKRTPNVFPSITTTYTVTYEDDRGCPFTDTVRVEVNVRPKPIVVGPDTVCGGEFAKYYVSSMPNTSFQWMATNGSIVGPANTDTLYVQWGYGSTGSIGVMATPQTGPCTGSTITLITIKTGIRPTIAGAGSICEGDTLTLTASAGYLKYLWSTGDTSQSIRVDSAGKYFVLGTIGNGCAFSSDTVDIIVHPTPQPIITPWMTSLPDSAGFDTLFVGGNYVTYDWSTGKQGDTLVILDSGTYSVTVTDSNGCVGFATIYIPRDSATPWVIVGTDTIIASPGDIVNFPVRLIDSKHLPESGATQWVTTFTFNRTLMAPQESAHPSFTQGRWRSLMFNNPPRPDTMERGILLPVSYMVTLGDTTETEVTVETFDFTNGKKPRVIRRHGLLIVRVCEADGERLYSDNGALLLGQNHPNPASTITTLDVDLREDGHTALILCDMLGRKVRTIIDGQYKRGHLQFDLDVSDLPRGKYIYVLQTPSAVRSNILQIER